MDEAAEAVELAYEDAAVQAATDAVAGFEHGAPAGYGAVVADEWQLLAEVARWSRMEARHLAGILLALDEGDDIVA